MAMRMTRRWMLTGAVAALLLPAGLQAQSQADRTAVERAAMDYLDGFYEGDADKIRRGVHPDVVKFGFMMGRDGAGYRGSPMTFDEMIGFADHVKQEGNFPAEDAPKEVILLEVQDQIAAAKVVAWWGMDYLHLAKYDGEWKILQVLWQTPPPGH